MTGLARRTDPVTSHQAGESIRGGRVSACLAMLDAFATSPGGGLTDEEAHNVATGETGECWWHRASDLRGLGLIEWLESDGRSVTRPGKSKRQRQVSVITFDGLQVAQGRVEMPSLAEENGPGKKQGLVLKLHLPSPKVMTLLLEEAAKSCDEQARSADRGLLSYLAEQIREQV